MTKVIKEARNWGGRELAVLLLSVSVLCASGFAEVIYENDFAERHSTGLIAGSTSAVYPASTIVSNVVSTTIYPNPGGTDATGTNNVVPARVGGSIPEPVGRDGWRRLLPTSAGNSDSVCVLKNWGANTCIRTEYESYHVGLAQHFGSVVSNGTLRMMVDMRMPQSFGSGTITSFRLAASLGNDTLYDAYRDDCRAGRFLHVGIGNGRHPRYLDADGTGHADDTVTLKASTWYRVEVVVHLDANPKTFDYVLYEQSSNPSTLNDATGTQVFAVSNVGGMNGVDAITTFALFTALSIGNYDNIRIWHTPPGAAQETLLYQNSFNTRVVWTKAAVLTDGAHNEAAALDGWKSLRTGFRDGLVFGEANNPAMSIYGNSDSGASGYVGQPIGEKLTVGEVTAQVDIRPPYGWLTSGGNAWFRLGGDGHLVPASGTEFLAPTTCGFGFNASSNNSRHEGFFTNCVIVAYQGDRNGSGSIVPASVPVDKSHWYRFVSTIRMRDSAYDVAVYDMGEDSPTLATPTPATPVTTFTNFPFRTANAALGGISSVSLTAVNIQPNLIDPKYPALFDNIRIERKVGGVTILFR